MDCSPSDSSVHGISQESILEWFAISFPRGSSQPRDPILISWIGRWILYHWTTKGAQQTDYFQFILFQNCYSFLIFLMKLRIFLMISIKSPAGILIGIKFLYSSGQNWYLYYVGSSNSRKRTISHLDILWYLSSYCRIYNIQGIFLF